MTTPTTPPGMPELPPEIDAIADETDNIVFELESAVGSAAHDLAGYMERERAKDVKAELRSGIKRLALAAYEAGRRAAEAERVPMTPEQIRAAESSADALFMAWEDSPTWSELFTREVERHHGIHAHTGAEKT